MRTLLTNATLIDCVQPRAQPDCAILIEGGRIEAIFRDGSAPTIADAMPLDLEGGYLMPGLWDVHVHPAYRAETDAPLPEQVTRFGHELQAALLQSGIVGLRCAGSHSFMDVAWKRAFDSGQHLGPRLFASGHFLTTTAGHFLRTGHALEVDGPYGWVAAIRTQFKNGVDHIKLNLSGGLMGPPWDLHHHSFLLDDELEAAFAICKQREFKVMAHATNRQAVKAALRLGAHSVEHGYVLDDECIELFLEHDAWYVPTLSVSHLTPDQATNDWERRAAERRNLPEAFARRAEAAAEEHRASFARALRDGVKMAVGSDTRPFEDGALLEVGAWVRAGATPWDAILAATRNAAAVCGVDADLGTVEPGKIADLIVLDADPLDDITNLRRLQLVLKDGRVVSDMRD